MRLELELLDNLLDVFTKCFDLTVITMNENGGQILPPKGDNILCNTLLHDQQESILDKMNQSLSDITNITRPLSYEILPGLYTIVAPIHIDDSPAYYVWAGLIVNDSSNDSLKDRLGERYNRGFDWDEVMENTPVWNDTNKDEWYKSIKKIVDLAASFHKEDKKVHAYYNQNQLFHQSLQAEQVNTDQLLSYFMEDCSEFDFLGLAEAREEDVYEISKFTGYGAESIIGARFSVGEGYLGRALVTGKYQYWEEIERDPRSLFFQRYDLYPKSFFCFPIMSYDSSITLFFGGNNSKGKLDITSKDFAKTMAAILSNSFYRTALKKENSQQLNRLSSLIEICKMMASIPDYKQIVYILVDISISLIEGPFSCVIIKEEKNDKVKLISRGVQNHEIGDYARDVIKRYYTDLENKNLDVKTYNDTTLPGTLVIECPLFYKAELLGILCVGTNSFTKSQLNEHIRFLQTLSIIGSVTLQLAKQNDGNAEDEKIYSLYRAIEQFDPAAYLIAQESAKLAGEFAAKQGLPLDSIKELLNACYLSGYSDDFVREILPESNAAKLVEEGKALMNHEPLIDWNDASRSTKLFALIYAYAQRDHIEIINTFSNPDDDLVQAFKTFIAESQVIEAEFSLAKEILGDEQLTNFNDTVQELNISPREQQVLELVIEGFNNREIAEKLYISGHTVKNHVTKIFQKLDVPDRAHAISKVYRLKYQGSYSG